MTKPNPDIVMRRDGESFVIGTYDAEHVFLHKFNT